eukprot:5754643-Pyramimonas_sp.AAC.1
MDQDRGHIRRRLSEPASTFYVGRCSLCCGPNSVLVPSPRRFLGVPRDQGKRWWEVSDVCLGGCCSEGGDDDDDDAD